MSTAGSTANAVQELSSSPRLKISLSETPFVASIFSRRLMYRYWAWCRICRHSSAQIVDMSTTSLGWMVYCPENSQARILTPLELGVLTDILQVPEGSARNWKSPYWATFRCTPGYVRTLTLADPQLYRIRTACKRKHLEGSQVNF